MKLRVTLAYGYYRVGDLIDVPALQAEHLLGQRYLGRPLVERVVVAATPTLEVIAGPPVIAEPPAVTPEPGETPSPRRKRREP